MLLLAFSKCFSTNAHIRRGKPCNTTANNDHVQLFRPGLSAPVPGGYESSLPAPRGKVGHYSAARYERRQGAALRQVGWPQYPDRREPPGDQRQIQPDIPPPLRHLEREALAGPLEYWGRSTVRWFARRSARQQTSDAIAPHSRPPRLSPEAALDRNHPYSGYAQANCAQ